MSVMAVLELLANDGTRVVIRDNDFHILATGFKFSWDVKRYYFDTVDSFTWQNDGNLFIDIDGI